MLFKKETERRDALSHIYIAPKKIIIKDGVENPAAISKGGSLEVSYTLDFNTDLVSENRFVIKVEEKEQTVR